MDPDYGTTPISYDEVEALLPEARTALPDPITRSSVFDLEIAFQEATAESLCDKVLRAELTINDLLDDAFLRRLHGLLYGDIWTWAAKYRTTEINIGVAPESINADLRGACGNFVYRWNEVCDLTPQSLALWVHAETVRIHPFIDGNGRTTRLLADLIFLAIQESPQLMRLNWDVDKKQYIDALRKYDLDRNTTLLEQVVVPIPLD